MSDPFLKFSAIPFNHNDFIQVGQTDVKERDETPEWQPFTFPLESITSVDNPIKIDCWDKDKKDDEYVGSCYMSLREMKCLQSKEVGVMLKNDKKKKKLGYKHSGILEVVSVTIN